jgi:hypothetical protein
MALAPANYQQKYFATIVDKERQSVVGLSSLINKMGKERQLTVPPVSRIYLQARKMPECRVWQKTEENIVDYVMKKGVLLKFRRAE